MTLSKHDQMVDTFPSDRADQSLRVAVLPGRSWRSRLVPNTHGPYPAHDDGTVNAVLVAHQIAWSLIPREGLGDLLRDGVRELDTAMQLSSQDEQLVSQRSVFRLKQTC